MAQPIDDKSIKIDIFEIEKFLNKKSFKLRIATPMSKLFKKGFQSANKNLSVDSLINLKEITKLTNERGRVQT